MTTLTLTIDTELYHQIKAAALSQETDVEKLFQEAIQHYMWELDRRKITAETKRYRQQYADLKAAYLGQYIAMHNGHVVDHDGDFASLYKRVKDRFGQLPVMIRRVEEAVDYPIVRSGFQIEKMP